MVILKNFKTIQKGALFKEKKLKQQKFAKPKLGNKEELELL